MIYQGELADQFARVRRQIARDAEWHVWQVIAICGAAAVYLAAFLVSLAG